MRIFMISDFQLYVKTRPSALGKSVLGVGPSDILDILELETPLFSSTLSTLSVFYVNIVIFNGLVSSAFLVHCCYYISLLPGWWNIVQNGDPLYAADDYKWDRGGHTRPNRLQFFLQKNTVLISQLFKKIIWALKKIIFGALMRHFFQTLVIFHKLRIKIVETMLSLNNYHYQTAFKTWGLILIFWQLFSKLIYWSGDYKHVLGLFKRWGLNPQFLKTPQKHHVSSVSPIFGGKSYKVANFLGGFRCI